MSRDDTKYLWPEDVVMGALDNSLRPQERPSRELAEMVWKYFSAESQAVLKVWEALMSEQEGSSQQVRH
jgi:hypothetical protein